MSLFQDGIARLSPYRVAQDATRVKLNQNEAPRDVPRRLKQKILDKLKTRRWHRYPPAESRALQRKLASYTGFPASGILVGNGSNELILALLVAVCGKGGSVLTVKPGFAVYKRTAGLLSSKIIEVSLDENLDFDLPAILEQAGKSRLVILASPHNPSGAVLEPEEVEAIADRTPGLLAVDEAYYEFHGRSAQSLISRKRNIVVLRTLSKAWRLAGARLGYLLGRREHIREVAKARLPFSVNAFALAAAEIMLDHRDHLDRLKRDVIRERERVFQALKDVRGVVPLPSSANFILFGVQDRSASWTRLRLRERGVEVRAFEDPKLKRHLRVTIGTPAENDAFLSAVRGIMRGVRA